MKRNIIALMMMLIVVIPSIFLFSGCDLFNFGSDSNNGSNNTTVPDNNTGNNTSNKTNVSVSFIDQASFYMNGTGLHINEFSYDYQTGFNSGRGQYCVLLYFKIIYDAHNTYYEVRPGRLSIYENDTLIAKSDIIDFRYRTGDLIYETIRITIACYYDESLPTSISYVAKLKRGTDF